MKTVLTGFEPCRKDDRLEFIGVSESFPGEFISLVIQRGKREIDGVDVVDLMATAIQELRTITIVSDDKDWEVSLANLQTRASKAADLVNRKKDDRSLRKLRPRIELALENRDPAELEIEGVGKKPTASIGEIPKSLAAFSARAKELAEDREKKKEIVK